MSTRPAYAASRETVEKVTVRCFRIPTDSPEADGTFAWNATTLVVAEVAAGRAIGLGYTYASPAAADVIQRELTGVIRDQDPFDTERLYEAMMAAVRNLGSRGACANAISAIDCAVWDLKAKLVGLPLAALLGAARHSVTIYGSGGFTSYDDDHLAGQLSDWVEMSGCRAVKMKIGSHPDQDLRRVAVAREAIGEAELYVDANGAFTSKQAMAFAVEFADFGVAWFEEPVSSDDLDGLRLVREHAPAGMEIAAGEYGYEPFYFRRMLESRAVDVMQADATRCGGVTGFLRAAALADAFAVPVSAHTAPSLHLPIACAAPRLRNIEWFHDHVRIEQMLFDGAPLPHAGAIAPDPQSPGFGLTLKEADARRYAI
jgi:L-alanine-DL-glutamate epimerase-like enolase superfamily enzyme